MKPGGQRKLVYLCFVITGQKYSFLNREAAERDVLMIYIYIEREISKLIKGLIRKREREISKLIKGLIRTMILKGQQKTCTHVQGKPLFQAAHR